MRGAPKRIARLDGIRAAAILLVILHHCGLLPSGWIGVEIFFVLSGYLITSILRRDREREHFWGPFYIKRATRILPPMLLLIAYVTIHQRPPLTQVAPYLFFLGNFRAESGHGLNTLNILWSLAIEEHFYLLFPFAVRFLHRRTLVGLLVAILVLEPLLRIALCQNFRDYGGTYDLTFFHLDGLAWGALLALLAEHAESVAWIERWSGLGFLCACAAYVSLCFLFPGSFFREANSRLFNGLGYSLIAIGSAALLSFVNWHPKAVISRLLELRPVVFVGTISYGLYLYHLHVRDFTQHTLHVPFFWTFLPTLVIGTALSWVSFRLMEQPLIGWGHRMASRLTAQGPLLTAGQNAPSSLR